jgi:hypothetical protein
VRKSGDVKRFANKHTLLVRHPSDALQMSGRGIPNKFLNKDVKSNLLGNSRPSNQFELFVIARSN